MRPFPEASLWILTLTAAGLGGCFAAFEVECGEDAHCNRFPGGLCHTNPQTDRRWCSYPDPACPHGYRYSDLDVGDGVSSACTGEPPARCDPTAEFGEPTLVPNVNSSNEEFSFSITRDHMIGFITRVIQPPAASATLLVTERASAMDRFDAPSAALTAAINNTVGNEHSGSSVADALILYFHRQTSAGIGIYAATRPDAQSAFSAGTPVHVDGNQLLDALSATISADGQTLYWLDFLDFGRVFAASRGGTPNTFTGRRVVSSIAIAWAPVLTADELTLYYAEGSGSDVLVSTRESKDDMFGTGIPVAHVNSPMEDVPVALSHDGCVLYISSTRSGGLGGHDLWVATRTR